MNNLIKNELTKIFHKKFIYIIFIILIFALILNYILENQMNNSNSDENLDEQLSSYEKILSELTKDSEFYEEESKAYKTSIEKIKLKKKYPENSWQRNYIDLKGEEIITNMITSDNTSEYTINKQKYDEFVKKLDTDNWQDLAKKDKEDYQNQLEIAKQSKDDLLIQSLQDKIQIINWRLDKNISYAESNKSKLLEDWQSASSLVLSYKSDNTDNIENSEGEQSEYEIKKSEQSAEGQKKLLEYAINNNVSDKMKDDLILNQMAIGTKADKDLIETFSNYSIIIVIAIVVVAGTIVSEEFNKGTIKLLLVKPYSRKKILAAKFIASVIITVLFSLATLIAQFVIGGIFNGFNDYANNILIYNFTKQTVQNINLFEYIGISFLCILPKLILLQTLAFALSAIFTNSPIAIAIPLLGVMGESIINNLVLMTKKARFLYFFVTPNWDFSIYLFGKYPIYENLTILFSILICLAYFVLMIFLANVFFKRKEIKNI